MALIQLLNSNQSLRVLEVIVVVMPIRVDAVWCVAPFTALIAEK